ncbi:hypothetical protein DDB_G0287355 [Dictyostelium discoideum AX4]|uniref:Putative uncharacterized protein DDB_G0287355 n=1 Tax=Dictyostelium discoideum TaxID=44689 RepID=Y7439_DICDI|nr:hypothetical protein DDB_G0287355 [Dictyostelium discoideum AX4]Q54KG6.1 RecName: Full=Putative uncharacterized protein DDB_G0287355 [Dictyostelium discoideum]EAL63745.1 hypothetical protein DDB_G0287355 [Dictyostelium discoideum AX4]|eukprot:XP_637257.1 hypothetical protein DDB_G0287355 [Dictyostelium discoideum AX4]
MPFVNQEIVLQIEFEKPTSQSYQVGNFCQGRLNHQETEGGT